ncbi:MAG TPA: RNA polymerase sigma factor [Polyangiaceae bacterium]
MSNSNTAAVRVVPAKAGQGFADQSLTTSMPSFADIYKTYFSFIWSITRYLGVERAEVDDVVQEVFVIIHRRMHSIEQPASLRSWIYSIIRRTVSRYHRTKRTKLINTGTERVEPETLQLDWSTPQSLAEQTEQVELLQSLLDKLDAPKREVFVLVELEEMTAPEIAAAIGVPLNTVYSRLRAARQELDEALQRHLAGNKVRG